MMSWQNVFCKEDSKCVCSIQGCITEENAKKYKQTFENEIHRVMIHGVLHLCGYNDKLAEETQIMRDKENHYLSLLA